MIGTSRAVPPGMTTTTTTATDLPAELTPTAHAALHEASRALLRYERLAARPRTPDAWAALVCRLWCARADLLKTGAIARTRPDGKPTDDYEFISARYRDAEYRREVGRRLEGEGRPALV